MRNVGWQQRVKNRSPAGHFGYVYELRLWVVMALAMPPKVFNREAVRSKKRMREAAEHLIAVIVGMANRQERQFDLNEMLFVWISRRRHVIQNNYTEHIKTLIYILHAMYAILMMFMYQL